MPATPYLDPGPIPVTYTPLPYVRGTDVGTLLRLQGQDRAAALQRQGDNTARLWENLSTQLAQAGQILAKQQQDKPYRDAQTADLKAQAAERDRQTAVQQQTDASNKVIDGLMKSSLTTDSQTGATVYDRNKLETGFVQAGIGHEWPKYAELVDKSDASLKTLKDSHKAAIVDVAKLVDASGNNAAVFSNELMRGVKNGLFTQQEAAPYLDAAQRDPASIAKVTSAILGKKPEDGAFTLGPGQVRYDETGKQIASGPAPPKTYQQKSVLLDGKPATVSFDPKTGQSLDASGADVSTRVRPIPRASATPDPSAVSDVKETVAGMKDGSLPPLLPGRATKEYLATMAEAHRQGFDLAGANTDWIATTKHLATMNGAQQLRLNQSVNALPDLLDTVDTLASKWKGGRFPLLNKANLAAAKNGVYGEDVASVARQLDAQIADVTADLGNVYMGGNSPTDQALSLAGKSLSGDWSQKTLTDMVALARKNVTIRQNSIKHTGVAGASADNPYGANATQKPASGPTVRDGITVAPNPDGTFTLSGGSLKTPGTVTQEQMDQFFQRRGTP